jgi:hypothetical protein
MANLRNLLWFVIGVLLVAVPMFSFAANFGYTYDQVTIYPTPLAACQSQDPQITSAVDIGHNQWNCMRNGGVYLQVVTVGACNSPNTVDGNGACVTPTPVDCTAGKTVTFTQKNGDASGSYGGLPSSDGACNLSGKIEVQRCYSEPNSAAPNQMYCIFKAKQSGIASPSGTPPSVVTPPTASAIPDPAKVKGDSNSGCPSGTQMVGYDSSAIPMCVGSGTDPGKAPSTVQSTPTQTTTNADGSTTTTDSVASTNSDGSQTTRTATCTVGTNGGKSCTTTIATGNTPAGTQGKNDTDPKTGDDTKGDSPVGIDGDLYGKGTKTMQDVMNHWTSAVGGAPFITAAQGFLGANVNGGACPSWRADVAYFKMSINLGQYFCAPGTETIFGYIGIGVMLGAAFLAFKIAFL